MIGQLRDALFLFSLGSGGGEGGVAMVVSRKCLYLQVKHYFSLPRCRQAITRLVHKAKQTQIYKLRNLLVEVHRLGGKTIKLVY